MGSLGSTAFKAAALAVLLVAGEARAARPEVAVVKSDDLGPYDKLVAGFSVQTKADVVEYSLRNDPQRAEDVFKKILSAPPAAILCVGPLAAATAKRLVQSIPVVFVLVPNHEKYGLSGPNITGIALTRPVKLQLETLRALAPRVKHVGVLYNPQLSQAMIDQAQGAAKELGLSIVPGKVATAEEVAAATKALVGKVDAVWMIADRTVASVDVFKSTLDFTLKQKIPLFALAEEQVREGALVSLAPDYSAIGQQAGRLVDRLTRDGVAPSAVPVSAPEGLDIAMNLTTAKRLGVECDVALEVFKLAARKGFPIKVYE
jgi:putative ABC transport system substrate-binding protein